MSAITGAYAFNEKGKTYLDKINDAVKTLNRRGPDGSGTFRHENVVLGHTRLAIIDLSTEASQPFTSSDGQYTLVIDGEILNYRELRKELEGQGVKFQSQSDREVLIALYSREKEKCLPKLNGAFAFVIYDKTAGTIFMARDRYGEKPLHYYFDTDVLIFGSEMKAIFAFGISKSISLNIVADYLHLNYVPQFRDAVIEQSYVHKKGVYTIVDNKDSSYANSNRWYGLPQPSEEYLIPTYEDATKTVRELVDNAVQLRLVPDVKVGVFLSGGLDSSIITALAAKDNHKIDTFSIGFPDEKYFDETKYATQVAKHLNTNHHVFSISNNDFLNSLNSFFETLDEPFADSSALALNILAKETKKHVKVALTGDGADELFAGSNKHEAEFNIRLHDFKSSFIKTGLPLWNILPGNRASIFKNKVRQLRKFAIGANLSAADRYWNWAGHASTAELQKLLITGEFYVNDKNKRVFTSGITQDGDLNEILRADMELVLEGNLNVKMDRMSMLNGLAVRSPFLDHNVVDYVMQLPATYKIQAGKRKRILKDSFAGLLPAEIYTRKKKGFDIPLQKWLNNELSGMIEELLNEKFLKEQNIFHAEEVSNIRKQLQSNNPGNSVARVWGLLVFQKYWINCIKK